MTEAAIAMPGITIGWPRRVVVLLGTTGAVLGAVSWWHFSDQSTVTTIVLVVLALTPAIPVFLTSRIAFITTCRLSSLLLVAVSIVLLPWFLIWSFLSAVALALIGESAQLARPLSRATLLFIAMLVTAGMIALFTFTAFFSGTNVT